MIILLLIIFQQIIDSCSILNYIKMKPKLSFLQVKESSNNLFNASFSPIANAGLFQKVSQLNLTSFYALLQCFKCKQKQKAPNILNKCGNCFRMYHLFCSSEISRNNSFLSKPKCQICLKKNQCYQCQIIILNHQKIYTCTICYRSIHENCSRLFSELFQSFQEGEFCGNRKNFICLSCLKTCGVSKIIRLKKILKNSFVHTFYFVGIKSSSPIHLGWFQERQITDNTIRCAQNDLEAKDYSKVFIERVLYIYQPTNLFVESQIQTNKDFGDLSRLFDRKRILNYGNQKNYQFLVKWSHRKYNQLVWQDQTIIMKYSSALISHLISHNKIYRIKLNHLSIINSLDKTDSKQKINFQKTKLEQNNNCKQTIQIINQNIKKNINQIIKIDIPKNIIFQNTILSSICYQSLIQDQSGPILIVCHDIKLWKNYIENYYSKFLDVLFFEGENQQIKIITEYLFRDPISEKPKFNLLVISFRRFINQKQFLFRWQFMKNLKLIVFHEIVDQFYFTIPVKCPKIYTLKSMQRQIEKKNKLLKEILQQSHHNHQAILDYHFGIDGKIAIEVSNTLQNYLLKANQIAKQKFTKKLFKHSGDGMGVQWSSLQRMSYLNFVLSFGMNFDSIIQMFKKYKRLTTSIIDINTETQLGEFKKYTTLFLSVLSSYHRSQQNIDRSYINIFLFTLDVSKVYKILCQLRKLRDKRDSFKDRIQNFNIKRMATFQVNGKFYSVNGWSPEQDYILVSLILQKGLWKWIQISQSKDWIRYTKQNVSEQIISQNHIKYKEHLCKFLNNQKQQVVMHTLVFFIEQRALQYLQDMD